MTMEGMTELLYVKRISTARTWFGIFAFEAL